MDMPERLTFENGAKAHLMGRFELEVDVICSDCNGEGCKSCCGAGETSEYALIPWTTIKDIYKSVVDGVKSGQIKVD